MTEDSGPGQPSDTLSHVDAAGRARMVDVADKDVTDRLAVAEGEVWMQAKTLGLIRTNAIQKGDVLTTAQLAGIMAAKRTHELIPLCHPLALSHIDVALSLRDDPVDDFGGAVTIRATVRCSGRTGVEMEALTAVSVAGLTVYDMAKAVDRGMRISNVRLRRKRGGRSGDIELP
jgi:cyclic pyranopterin phosphate synthase